MAGKFKVRPIAGHEPVPTFKRFIDQDDSRTHHQMSHIVFISPPLLTSRYYQDGMVQLQSVNQRSKKQAKLSMPPQWGQTLYQVASLFKMILESAPNLESWFG